MPVAELRILDRAVYLPESGTLVIADLHVGRAAASEVDFPLDERGDLCGRLDTLLDPCPPEAVVIAGDILHAFDRVPHGVEETLDTLAATVEAAGATLTIVSGNHDAMLGTLVDGPLNFEHRLADGTVVCHGHEEPTTDADRYVIGHEHPAIEIEGQRHPCVLYGERAYDGADVLVLPAFSRLASGMPVNDLRSTDALSPILRRGSLDEYRPIVLDDGEPLAFPRLRSLREFL